MSCGRMRAADSIGQQTLREHARKDVRLRPAAPAAAWPDHSGACRRRARRVASIGVRAVERPPLAGVVEVLEREPIGSISRWHDAHTGFARCSSIRWRSDVTFTCAASFSRFVSTPGGGFGGGAPSTFSSTHLPRVTGDVRFAADVTVRMLPCPSRPAPRDRLSARRDATHARAVDVRNAVVPRQALVDEREVRIEQVDDAAILPDDRAEEHFGFALRTTAAGCRPSRANRAGRSSTRAAAATAPRSCRRAPRRADPRASAARAARSTAGVCSAPRFASAISASSGMLLHRKNDSRDASSKSLSRNGAPGATSPARARSGRGTADRRARGRPRAACPTRTCRSSRPWR